MSKSEPSPEEVIESIYAYAAELMNDGVSPASIEKKLIEEGLSAEAAATVVENLKQARIQAAKKAGRKNMIYGALWCVGGIIVTAATYQSAAAEGGGKYMVAWGAILFGGIQFLRGLNQTSEE